MLHFNHEYEDGLPVATGDRYYAQDLAQDNKYLASLPVELMSRWCNADSGILRGFDITTQLDDNNQLYSITVGAGVGFCKVNTKVIDPEENWEIPPITKDEQIFKMLSITDPLTITNPSGQYLCLKYKPIMLLERERVATGGRYFSYIEDSCELVVSDTVTGILIGTISGNTITKSDITSPIVGGGSSAPIGSIQASSVDISNDGYILCDGRAVSRTDYAELFAKVGTTFGSGDGSTTFNIPDLRDKFIEGASSGIGNTGGEATHELTVGEMPIHRHSFSGSQSHSHSLSKGGSIIATAVTSGAETTIGLDSGGYWAGETKARNSIASATVTISGNTAYTGNGEAHNNLPPYMKLYYFIKARNISQQEVQDAIDDTKTTASNVWSAEKVNSEITNTSKKFPDYARGRLTTLNYSLWTATEDFYFTDTTISINTSDTANYHTKINGVDVCSNDVSQLNDGTGRAVYIYMSSGYGKRGDVIFGSPRCKIYGLKS